MMIFDYYDLARATVEERRLEARRIAIGREAKKLRAASTTSQPEEPRLGIPAEEYMRVSAAGR